MGEMRNNRIILVEKPAGKIPLWRLGVHGRIILKCVVVRVCAGFNWLRMGFSCGLLWTR